MNLWQGQTISKSIGYLCSMPYVGQGKKDFWISRMFDPAKNSLKIIKESPEKYKGNYAISVLFIFRLILFLENYFKACISFCLTKTALLIPKCHKMAFYDIL